jgi:hypothetical protein
MELGNFLQQSKVISREKPVEFVFRGFALQQQTASILNRWKKRVQSQLEASIGCITSLYNLHERDGGA